MNHEDGGGIQVPDVPQTRREAQGAERRRRLRPRNSVLAFLFDFVIVVLIALVASWAVRTFLFRSFYVPSESMVSTLDVNDRIIVNNLYPNVFGLERGDIVVFKDPGGWLTDSGPVPASTNPLAVVGNGVASLFGLGAQESNEYLVKRVIGLPGDTVQCCDASGRLQINGVSIDETYLDPGVAPSLQEFSANVPQGSIWVMGDNREHSADSRANTSKPTRGFVPLSNVVGRAVVISWPVSRWTGLDNYSSVFAAVPDAVSSKSASASSSSSQ